jgi:tripartite-type tricarboxylate transporter receptor subunit TctC
MTNEAKTHGTETMKTSLAFGLALGAILGIAFSFSAGAQTYPNRPIRLIVPIATGSVTDVASRLMAQELSEAFGGTPVVVDNRPGANMVIGGTECAKAAGDGYTLCVVSPDTMSFNPFTIPNLPYDPDRDFRPVTNMYYVVEGLIGKQALPVNNIEELKKLAIAQPSAINFGTLGEGTTTDMYRAWLNEEWKTKIVGVPYKGGSEIINALLSGTIDISKIGMGNIAGRLNDGSIKTLALRSKSRSELLPNVPTLTEAGLRGFPGGPIFWGIVVPKSTPDAIVERVQKEVAKVLRGPKFVDFAKKQFLEIDGSTQAEFAAFLKEDRESARVLIKKYGAAQ